VLWWGEGTGNRQQATGNRFIALSSPDSASPLPRNALDVELPWSQNLALASALIAF